MKVKLLAILLATLGLVLHHSHLHAACVPFSFNIQATAPTTSTGTNGSIIISGVSGGTAPYSYSIATHPDSCGRAYVPTAAFLFLPNGIYYIRVRDANGNPSCCVQVVLMYNNTSGPFIIHQSPLAVSITAASGCCPLAAQATGGCPEYRYQWSNGSFNDSLFCNLDPGTYSVTVTDRMGCTATASYTVTGPCCIPWLLGGNFHSDCKSSVINSTNNILGIRELNPNRLRIFTNNLERMTVAAGGNVGIGTQTPNFSLLEVERTVAPNDAAPIGSFSAKDAVGRNHRIFFVPKAYEPPMADAYSFNTESGDAGIFFTDGSAGGGQNAAAGLTIAPWSTNLAGMRMNRFGNICVGSIGNNMSTTERTKLVLSPERTDKKAFVVKNTPLNPTQPDSEYFQIYPDGRTVIGLSPTGATYTLSPISNSNCMNPQFSPAQPFMLYVRRGGIHTSSIRSDVGFVAGSVQWCDYVFDEKYKLLSLQDVEKFISQNHHLPNIPPASEIETNGMELANMSSRQMEKIEDLYLYLIEMNKRVAQLEADKLLLEQQLRELQKK